MNDAAQNTPNANANRLFHNSSGTQYPLGYEFTMPLAFVGFGCFFGLALGRGIAGMAAAVVLCPTLA